ncbi:hypothetical protein ACE3MS_07515 [Paenibacillus dendritiformis]|uniref:hypothetical protein n=1 Tax=Paenibacillus dendritiformis TaxID=130049 RepID=UPI0036507BFC
MNKEELVNGEYIGARSRQKVNLINHGGMLLAAPDLRDAYHISNMIPATLSKKAALIECGEILFSFANNRLDYKAIRYKQKNTTGFFILNYEKEG